MSRLQRTVTVLCAFLALSAALGGCVVYDTPPPGYAPGPGTFDRSYAAAVGAFADEGVQITLEDRATGTIRGHLGETTVSAEVRQQADGSVRVEFEVGGNVAANPSLKDRVVRSYSRRMGR
jgi:hypothetical protein